MFLNCSPVSEDTPPTIRSSKTVIATSGFTYAFGCRPLRCSGRQPKTHVKPEVAITVFELLMVGGVSSETVEQLRNIGIISSTTQSHLVGSFYEIYITRHGSMNMRFTFLTHVNKGHAVAQLVEALRYKPESCEFDFRWCHWNFSLT